jgi:FAD/FMN-containing dehydrogenase
LASIRGKSLAGQTANIAVALDFSKYMNQVLAVDPERKTARVQPGVINDHLNAAAAGYGLVFPPDPATHAWATLGGAIGNNSCGTHSLLAPPGRTSDFVEELDILLYDGTRMTVGPSSDEEIERIIGEGGRRGEIYRGMRELRDRYGDLVRERFPKRDRRVLGFNLDELLPKNGFHVARTLVGTERTCATMLEATVRLVENPKKWAMVVMGYPSIFVAAGHVGEIREQEPSGLEAVSHNVVGNLEYKGQRIEAINLLPEGQAWLFAEFPGESAEEARNKAEALQQKLEGRDDAPNMVVIEDDGEQAEVWAVRESAIGASRIPGEMDTWAAWEDGAVPTEHLGEFLREFEEIIERHGRRVVLFGHFGQGCVHARTDNDLKTAEGIRDFREFMVECADLTVKYGGSLSPDRHARARYLWPAGGEDDRSPFWELGHRLRVGVLRGAVAGPLLPRPARLRPGLLLRPRTSSSASGGSAQALLSLG